MTLAYIIIKTTIPNVGISCFNNCLSDHEIVVRLLCKTEWKPSGAHYVLTDTIVQELTKECADNEAASEEERLADEWIDQFNKYDKKEHSRSKS